MNTDMLITLLPFLTYYPRWVQFFFLGTFILFLISVVLFVVFFHSAVQAKKRPVHIEFEQAEPYIYRTRTGSDITKEYWRIFYSRIRIVNHSDEFTARNCHLKLTDLEYERNGRFERPHNFEPVILKWERTQLRDLKPDDDVFIPFARIGDVEYQKRFDKLLSGDVNTPQLRFTVAHWPRWMSSHIEPGKHRFKLAVYFDDRPAVEQEFELDWSGKWQDGISKMLNELKVTMLDETSNR